MKTVVNLSHMPAALHHAVAWLRDLGADVATIKASSAVASWMWMLWLVPPWTIKPRHDIGIAAIEIRQGEDA